MQEKSQSGAAAPVRCEKTKPQARTFISLLFVLHVLIFSVIGRNAINIPEIFQVFMVSPVARQKLKSFILLFIACVASISVLFWRKTARKMALVSLLAQPKTENLIPRSFFATKQHGNTCYTG